jgi:predicted TIM-barrel fold metal-dependent hydrolase
VNILPAGAWDCHAHVIGDVAAFPFRQDRGYTPRAAPLEAYLAMLDRHGIANGVLVQPSVYGFDNRCLLDALDRAGGRLFGVAVPPVEARASDLEAMHLRGVRGVRCNLLNPGGLPPAVVITWQPVLRALGWHVELHVAVEDIHELSPFVDRFGVPVVIDHLGRPAPGRADPLSPALRPLVDLVRAGGCFVKLSAPYRGSREAAPWRDVAPLASACATAKPDACLWGSDWPHVDTAADVCVDDLITAFADVCPDANTRHAIATGTARTLFGPGPGESSVMNSNSKASPARARQLRHMRSPNQ